ncbi:MAG: PKD domain-containing protein [Asgard group archaeon]|nr:PKD domain-containing protein [Asgard group archaeon]
MKKNLIIIIPLLSSIFLLSGCTEEISQIIEDITSKNSRPVGVISAPENAYFEETIVFDASNSYDLDGSIVQFSWDFGDGETAEGKTVEYTYKFDNNFDIEYPLIFQISLVVKDNNDSITGTNHQIKISPRKYKFYLDAGKITLEQPLENEEKIKATFGMIRKGNELTYALDDTVNITPCKWNLNLHIKKPFLKYIKSVSVTLSDDNNKEILKANYEFKIFNLWRDKVIKIENKMDKKFEFKSIRICVQGFSILKRVSIIYSGQEPSSICFDFT